MLCSFTSIFQTPGTRTFDGLVTFKISLRRKEKSHGLYLPMTVLLSCSGEYRSVGDAAAFSNPLLSGPVVHVPFYMEFLVPANSFLATS